jgi:hypothetical protein
MIFEPMQMIDTALIQHICDARRQHGSIEAVLAAHGEVPLAARQYGSRWLQF